MGLRLRSRIISAFIIGGVVAVFLYYRGPMLLIPATIAAIAGVIEFNLAYKHAGFTPMIIPSVLLSLLALISFSFYDTHNFKVAIVVACVMFFLMLAYHVVSKHQIIDIIITMFSMIYVVFPILLMVELSKRPDNFLWLVFVLAISTDVSAYFVGKRFGKHKLIEEVSPKKTVEGAIGGIFGCVLASVAFKWFFLPEVTLLGIILLSALGSLASQVGDLTASKIKRYCGIKDFSHIIPGHGGILDRLDSILFTGTIVFIYVWVYF